MGFRAAQKNTFISDMSSAERKIVRARGGKIIEPFNLCYETSFKLMDDLHTGGFEATMMRCSNLITDAPDADIRWHDLAAQSRWVHFIVKVGEEAIDLTRRQFFPFSPFPFVQSWAECEAEWGAISVAELRNYMRAPTPPLETLGAIA
jgi:hypothetical protein